MKTRALTKIAATILLLLATTAGLAQELWDCGKFSGTVTATLDGGTLIISGTGAMADFDWNALHPWRDFHNSITAVTIQDGVTSIGDRAFADCANLTSITIPNSVTSIGRGAFANSGLTSITIPESLTAIGDEAFIECNSLEAINVADDNTAYRSVDGILYNKAMTDLIKCPAKKTGTITIPASVTTIKDWAFYNCALTSITISDNVVSIGAFAFYRCKNLTSVTISGSVVSIGDEAFTSCAGLTSVVNESTTPQVINGNVFEGVAIGEVELHLPQSAASAYQSAAVWQNFKHVFTESATSAIADNDRVIIAPPETEYAAVVPVSMPSGEFVIGPNPVARIGAARPAVWIYRQGKRVDNAALIIFDAMGNVINKINITDKALTDLSRRAIGSWNLRDANGRVVPKGTYLVKGVVKTPHGQSEKVSLILSVK